MKKIIVVMTLLLIPATGFADSVTLHPLEVPPPFADKVVFSYVTAGTWRPAVVEACLKAQRFMKGFNTVEVSSLKIDKTKSTVTCTVTGDR